MKINYRLLIFCIFFSYFVLFVTSFTVIPLERPDFYFQKKYVLILALNLFIFYLLSFFTKKIKYGFLQSYLICFIYIVVFYGIMTWYSLENVLYIFNFSFFNKVLTHSFVLSIFYFLIVNISFKKYKFSKHKNNENLYK